MTEIRRSPWKPLPDDGFAAIVAEVMADHEVRIQTGKWPIRDGNAYAVERLHVDLDAMLCQRADCPLCARHEAHGWRP